MSVVSDDWGARKQAAEKRAAVAEAKLVRLVAAVKEQKDAGRLGVSEGELDALQEEVDATCARVEGLERTIDALTNEIEMNLLALGAPEVDPGQSASLYAEAMQSMSQASSLSSSAPTPSSAARTANSSANSVSKLVPAVSPADKTVEVCVGVLYNFVTHQHLFRKATNSPTVRTVDDVAKCGDAYAVAGFLINHLQSQAPFVPGAHTLLVPAIRNATNEAEAAFQCHLVLHKLLGSSSEHTAKFSTLKLLFGFLAEVAKEQDLNRSPSGLLGEIFGITLFGGTSSVAEPTRIMIEHCDLVFDKKRSNRVFTTKTGPSANSIGGAWKQYDESGYERGNVGNVTAKAGHSGIR